MSKKLFKYFLIVNTNKNRSAGTKHCPSCTEAEGDKKSPFVATRYCSIYPLIYKCPGTYFEMNHKHQKINIIKAWLLLVCEQHCIMLYTFIF